MTIEDELAEIGRQVAEEQARQAQATEAARLERVAAREAARLERARRQLAELKGEATQPATPRRRVPPPPETSVVETDSADES